MTRAAMPVTRMIFIARMAAYAKRQTGTPFSEAYGIAGTVLAEFLENEKISFGAPEYDWSVHGAIELMASDMQYWETQ